MNRFFIKFYYPLFPRTPGGILYNFRRGRGDVDFIPSPTTVKSTMNGIIGVAQGAGRERKSQCKQLGFTLLEILVALTLFALLSTITASVLFRAFDTQTRISQRTEHLNTLALALTLMERDTNQAIDRAVRGNNMHLYAPFIGEVEFCEFTRAGIANPHAAEKRSSLQRIAYLCKDQQLIRRTWQTLDTINRKHYHDKILLTNLIQCRFAYLNSSLQVLATWSANALRQNQRQEPLPHAIQLALTLKDKGKLTWLFLIPEARYVDS